MFDGFALIRTVSAVQGNWKNDLFQDGFQAAGTVGVGEGEDNLAIACHENFLGAGQIHPCGVARQRAIGVYGAGNGGPKGNRRGRCGINIGQVFEGAGFGGTGGTAVVGDLDKVTLEIVAAGRVENAGGFVGRITQDKEALTAQVKVERQ